MIQFFNDVVNPVVVERLRLAQRWLLVLVTYILYAPIFFAVLVLFLGYLAVVYGQRLFNFAIDCFLGVLE